MSPLLGVNLIIVLATSVWVFADANEIAQREERVAGMAVTSISAVSPASCNILT